MLSIPRWYCPQGVAVPAHLPPFARQMAQQLCDGVGPDPIGGGRVFGGSYDRNESGWIATTAGHWINFSGSAPQALAKIDTHPRILHWRTVHGAQPNHHWQIPVLLNPVYDGHDQPISYRSALERIWQQGWVDPSEFITLQQQLRAVALNIGDSISNDQVFVDLISNLIGLGHDLHPVDLAASGWLNELLCVKILMAAFGMENTHG